MSAILGGLLLIGSLLGPASGAARAATAATSDTATFALGDSTFAKYAQEHGGAAALGKPISNPMQLLGRRVQLFERLALEVRPDGSVGPLDLLGGDVMLSSVVGASLAPDPIQLARIPTAGLANYTALARAYLDAAAPETWSGQAVRFGSTFRSAVRCVDLPTSSPCDQTRVFAVANDLWGLPTAAPVADPRNSDYVYLSFQRGVMVYSSRAGDTQWLLLGNLFKRILQGGALPPDMLTQIAASPTLARFYAQYDPLARDSLARPNELTGTSLTGAFAGSSASTAPIVASPAPPSPAAQRPQLDTRFGVAEGFDDPGLMAELHAGWERVVIPWDQVQPDSPEDFSHLGMTLPADRLRAEVSRGIHVTGVLQFTPKWAQLDAAGGQRSAPQNLELPFDDPRNYWGRFVSETVHYYAGQIDDWIIWNEPDFRPGDPGGGAYSWAGSDEQFARLLSVGYQAAKKANPAAIVSFPATSYWVDEISSPKRTPFYERLLRILTNDPYALAHNLYHDAVALNLYRSPDDVYRVSTLFTAIQHRYGINKPIWLTEVNAMPTDDPLSACIDHQAPPGMRVSLDQQAGFAVQSFALAAAAGYQRIEFYSMMDDATCQYPPWGLVRSDGTRRPVADALRTAVTYFSHFTAAQFAPLVRRDEAWSAWPNNPNSYIPNWQVYEVALDRPGNQRVTVLWNGDGAALRVRVPKNGASARVVDRSGLERSAREEAGAWVVDLPAATARVQSDDANSDPDGYHVIGGDPLLLVEEAVDPAAAVVPPKLGGG